ncbi:hypothetical protein LNV47_01580 [Paucibacter sp. DJ4R-1]|nr:hypothetical protein [Paucibacter sp. DJ4R-1]
MSTRIAFAACAYATYRPVQPAWQQILDGVLDLDRLLLLGDAAYLSWDDAARDFAALNECYEAQFPIDAFLKLIQKVSVSARRYYAELYGAELTRDFGSTLIDGLLERRAPMLLRVAMVLALTDQQWLIEERHLEAAKLWIRCATDSVSFVFSGSAESPSATTVRWAAERIADFLAVRGSASREDLVVDCFGRHQPATVVDAAIAHLIQSSSGRVSVETRPRATSGPGRPATVYRLVPGNRN